MEIKKLEELLKGSGDTKKLVVVAAHDDEVLEAVVDSLKLKLVEPILIGDEIRIREILNSLSYNEDIEIIDEADIEVAAEMGVKLVNSGKADFIMKGLVDTAILLKAVLNKEWGLRTESLLSHVMIYELDSYHKLLGLTDGGMNLYPSLEDKKKIIDNGVIALRAIGKEEVKVACLAAKEKVNDKMPATVDAGQLKLMYENGDFSKGVIVEGPMALDLAVSKESARTKGYVSPVAGEADMLLVPNIEMGNGIGKSMTYFAKAKSAGVIMGAKVPIVLTSRADDHLTKLYSIGLGVKIANLK